MAADDIIATVSPENSCATLPFMTQAGCDQGNGGTLSLASVFQENFREELQPEAGIICFEDGGTDGELTTQLQGEASTIRQPLHSKALEELNKSLQELGDQDALQQVERSVIVDKMKDNLSAVVLEVHQNQARIERMIEEKQSLGRLKQRLERSSLKDSHRFVTKLGEVTTYWKQLLSENGVLINGLTSNYSRQEKEIASLKTRLAEKEKEHHQSRMEVHQLQVKLFHSDSRMTQSIKQAHEKDNQCPSSSHPTIKSAVVECQSGIKASRKDNQPRKTLSLDQRIMKERCNGKLPTSAHRSSSSKNDSVELEIARVRGCSLWVDKILDMQYGEIQKLLMKWKDTGSDQLFRIWTF